MQQHELELAYETHEDKVNYMECFYLLRCLLVVTESYKAFKCVKMPNDATSNEYLLAGKELQSFFINLCSVMERANYIDGLKGISPKLSLDATHDSLRWIAKAIRNKTSHEGVWPPVMTHQNKWFSYGKSEIDELLRLILNERNYEDDAKGQRKKQREQDRVNCARGYLADYGENLKYVCLAHLMKDCMSKFLIQYLEEIEQKAKQKGFETVSSYRLKLQLTPLDGYISEARQQIESNCSD